MALILKGRVSTELGIRSPAIKFFHVFIKQLHNLPNIAERVHEAKVHQGDDWHGIGSIKMWTFTLDGKKETCKESIEAIDEENKSATFNVFDGDVGKKYKTFKFNLQVIDKEGGGVVIWTFDYEKLNEDIAPPYPFMDYVTSLTNDIDAHLLKEE